MRAVIIVVFILYKGFCVSKVQFIEIEEDRVDQRLDNFLTYVLNNVPKSRVYRLIRKGEVRINGKRAKPDTKLNEGDMVRIPPVSDAIKAVATVEPGQKLRQDLKAAVSSSQLGSEIPRSEILSDCYILCFSVFLTM